MDDTFCAAAIKKRTDLVDIKIYQRLGSTNARAITLVENGELSAPGAVIACHQTLGRGQANNGWFADNGSLTATIVLKEKSIKPLGNTSSPSEPIAYLPTIPLRAALGVHKVLSKYISKERIKIKWPNDVLVDGKKICGILCKQLHQTILIGIGLNVTTNLNSASDDIQQRAITIEQLTNTLPTRCELFIKLYNQLLFTLNDTNWHKQYHQCDFLQNKTITINDDGKLISGKCAGIDEQGRLLIDDTNNRYKITNGSITNIKSLS